MKTHFGMAAVALLGLAWVADARAVRHEFWELGGAAGGPALTLTCQGTNYSLPLAIQRVAPQSIDRSTVRGLIEAYYAAIATDDTNIYSSLFVPGQRNPRLTPGSGSRLTGVSLGELTDYGPGHIAVVNLHMGTNVFPTARAIKKQGGQYYFTSELVTDKGFAFYSGLVTSTSYVHQITSGAPGSGALIETTCAAGATDGACIVFEMQGTNYSPALYISTNANITISNQDLRTIDGSLSAIAAAVAAGDSTWFLSLVCPEEIDQPVEIIAGSPMTLRSTTTNQMDAAKARVIGEGGLRVIKRVAFGRHVFVFLSTSKCLVFKQVNGRWLLTDSMNRGDKIGCFILGAGSPNCHLGPPNVLP